MDKIFSARLDETTLHEMNRAARRLGITKKRFLEEAIRLRTQQAGAGADIWAETLGAWKRREAPEESIAAARRAFRKSFERHHRGRNARLHR